MLTIIIVVDMSDERVVEEIITDFLISTCRKRSELSRNAADGAFMCIALASAAPDNDAEADRIPLTTGSAAEFYIEPMLPHVGDVDVMYHLSTELAIPQGQPPPTQLPAEFHNYVNVLEIIDSRLAGYVYLKPRYLLTECIDEGKYDTVEYDKQPYVLNLSYAGDDPNDTHGPAFLVAEPRSMLPTDSVPCVRSLVWPPQAADWPIRHRNYGWPDSATVDCVVNNGCDVVHVAHRQCRQEEWENTHQHRLSFSRAEIVLLNSWMPVQQIVYHMLRVFVKTELLTDSADNSEAVTLSNYHIKTLMLWACELKPRIWWTDDLNLLSVCHELLHDLAVWLNEARCPHYFINNCNLMDKSFNLEMLRSPLILSKSWLSSWYVDKYIRRCAQFCPQNVSWLCDDVSSPMKLQNAVSAIVEWKLKDKALNDMWTSFNHVDYHITYIVSSHSVSVRSLACWFTELRKIGTSLPINFFAVVFLHAACRIAKGGLNDQLMNVLEAIVGASIGNGPRRYSSRRSSVLLLSKAASLMKAVDDRPESRGTVQLIAFQLSGAFLHRTLSCVDCDRDSIYCLANVYLAVLYYATGQYQTAIDHCTLVTRSQDHSQSQRSSHVVQGDVLPKNDDDVDTVLGLAVFYQHVRTAALNQQQQTQQHTHVTVFTTELFARYLLVKCLSVTKCQQLSDTTDFQSSSYEVRNYTKCIADTQQLFIADVLLWKSVNGFYGRKHVCKLQTIGRQFPSKYPTELSASELVELLQKSAVEHLTTFRQMIAQDFVSAAMSPVTFVTTDFEALYAYKCGDYQQCLELSTQNVHTLLDAKFAFVVATFPEFVQLLDDDIVSLTALTLIVNRKCREVDSRSVCISQLALSLYLMTQCQLKLPHSSRSLFQTLQFITAARRRHRVQETLDQLVLKMIEYKAKSYIRVDLAPLNVYIL